MKEIIVGPHVASTFPKHAFPKTPKFQGEKQAAMYLDLLEDVLILDSFTMLSQARLRNIRDLLNAVLWANIPGHFIETGVWRGGASIYARACIEAFNCVRRVYVADSFAGLPPPDPRYPADAGDQHYLVDFLKASLEEVQAGFKRFGFDNDEQTIFVKGWFDESLPALLEADKNLRFSVIRLDGDMYGSTMDALLNLYDRLSPGGFCIVDDFSAVAGCQKAVNQFRADRGIEEQMWNIDDVGIFWQKEKT